MVGLACGARPRQLASGSGSGWGKGAGVLAPALHRVTKAAHRRKALPHDDLPLGVLSLDGKTTAIEGCDDHYAQPQTHNDESSLVGAVRMATATLVSCSADQSSTLSPSRQAPNERGHYEHALLGQSKNVSPSPKTMTGFKSSAEGFGLSTAAKHRAPAPASPIPNPSPNPLPDWLQPRAS